MESTESFNPDFNSGSGAAADANGPPTDATPASPVDGLAAHPIQGQEQKQDAPDAQLQQKVHDVLHSDIGVNTLLNRLKASIASARVRAIL